MKYATCTITGLAKGKCFISDGYAIEENDNEEHAIYSKKGDKVPTEYEAFKEFLKNRALTELGCVITEFRIMIYNPQKDMYDLYASWEEPAPVLQ